MSYGARFAAGCFLCLGLLGNPNGITTVGPSFGRSRQLPCVFETIKMIPLSKETEIIRLNVWLLLSRTGSTDGQGSQPENLPPDNIPSFIVQALLLVHTAPTCLSSALAKDVLMDCAFSTDHQADVTVQWARHHKGGHKKRLLAYSGSSKQAEHVARHTEVVLEEIPKGNTSLLLRNAEIREEGTYSCLVSVAFLTVEQMIQLQIEEKPTVALNFNSLLLVEGEQHKLVCNIKHYYPQNVQAQWLCELKDSWKVPDVMKNVLSSSLQRSSDGTYSSSRDFLLTASVKDNGHSYTCHQSLQTPIRRSCGEVASTVWLLLLLSLIVLLMGVFLYHQKAKITSRLLGLLSPNWITRRLG